MEHLNGTQNGTAAKLCAKRGHTFRIGHGVFRVRRVRLQFHRQVVHLLPRKCGRAATAQTTTGVKRTRWCATAALITRIAPSVRIKTFIVLPGGAKMVAATGIVKTRVETCHAIVARSSLGIRARLQAAGRHHTRTKAKACVRLEARTFPLTTNATLQPLRRLGLATQVRRHTIRRPVRTSRIRVRPNLQHLLRTEQIA